MDTSINPAEQQSAKTKEQPVTSADMQHRERHEYEEGQNVFLTLFYDPVFSCSNRGIN